MNLSFVTYLIVFFGIVNLFRMTLFLIGSDFYALYRHLKRKKDYGDSYLPIFSVIIPAYNEEKTILRAVSSVLENGYPQDKLQLVVIDDGSTDQTLKKVVDFRQRGWIKNLKIIRQRSMGKAHALNSGMRLHPQGELVMCLDSDSYLETGALEKSAQYFKDPEVMAVAANVKIIDSGSLLNLIQKFEYLICYQMKRAQTFFNIEYIIGGIGSTFRRSALAKVGYYDTNTVTEDIDVTMKILREGNKNCRVIYGADIIAHTESVLTIGGLIRQRYRWKWGRSQTFLKNKAMFFSPQKRFTKGLAWFYLPFAIFCDFAFLWEPWIIGYILYVSIAYRDPITILSAMAVIVSYISFNTMKEETLTAKEKVKLVVLSPAIYFYILSFVEYLALIRTLMNLKNLKKSLRADICAWQHVERGGIAITS